MRLSIGIKPTVWHINEGHAAFMMLERIRDLVRQEQDFASALEAVAANTVLRPIPPYQQGMTISVKP